MKITENVSNKLAANITRQLLQKQYVSLQKSESDCYSAIAGYILEQEKQRLELESQVSKLLDQYSDQIQDGNIDGQQMYGMIRKQVAKQMKYELDPESRVSILAHRIHDRLYLDALWDYQDENKAMQVIKKILSEVLLAEGALDEKVRKKIASLSRQVAEGSSEWEVLYQQYMEEELNKHGL